MIGKKETTYEKEKLRMAGLCARSEQCEFDIRAKLDKTSLSSAYKNQLISFLRENKFIDDHRFAGSFTRDKVKFAKWGKAKIKYYLINKRLPSSIIKEALEEVDEEEYLNIATSLIKSKLRSLDINSREDMAKLYRAMATRGFSSNVIKQALLKIRQEETE